MPDVDAQVTRSSKHSKSIPICYVDGTGEEEEMEFDVAPVVEENNNTEHAPVLFICVCPAP